MISEETLEKIKHLLPIRVIIQLDDEYQLKGLVEESFSMSLSPNRIMIFWSGKAYSILGEHNMNGIEWANANLERVGRYVINPLDEDSPVNIDFEKWREHVGSNTSSKFDKRNAIFTVNEHNYNKFLISILKEELNIINKDYKNLQQECDKLHDKLETIYRVVNTEE